MLKEFLLLKSMLMRKPILSIWQITGRCNFTCRICRFWQENNRAEDELTLPQIKTILEKLKPRAPMIISLAGGEPLLRDDLPAIVSAVSRDHYCSIITNGYLMTRPLARSLFDNGLTDAMVSIDYATPERHDDQRGVDGAFSHAIDALTFLRDARKGKRNKVRILTVLMDDNIGELEGLLLIAKELSVSFALTLYSDDLGKKPDYAPKGNVSEYLLELKKRHPHFDSATEYLASFDRAIGGGMPRCGGGRTFANIDHHGRIARCIDRRENPAADLLKDNSGTAFSILDGQNRSEPCARCWTSCRGIADVVSGVSGIKQYADFGRSLRQHHTP
jgi:MoaA/NifB/PqqE/SkfB family radical SAM enzyme